MGFAGKGKGPTDDVLDGLSKQTQFKDKNIIVPQEFKDSGKIRVPLDQPPVYSDDYNWPKSVNMDHLIEHPNPELKGLYIPTKDFALPGPSNQYNVPYLQKNFVTVAPYKPGRMAESDYLIQQENKYFSEKGTFWMETGKNKAPDYELRGWTTQMKSNTYDHPVAIQLSTDNQKGRMQLWGKRNDEVITVYDQDFQFLARNSVTGTEVAISDRLEPKFKDWHKKISLTELKKQFNNY